MPDKNNVHMELLLPAISFALGKMSTAHFSGCSFLLGEVYHSTWKGRVASVEKPYTSWLRLYSVTTHSDSLRVGSRYCCTLFIVLGI